MYVALDDRPTGSASAGEWRERARDGIQEDGGGSGC